MTLANLTRTQRFAYLGLSSATPVRRAPVVVAWATPFVVGFVAALLVVVWL